MIIYWIALIVSCIFTFFILYYKTEKTKEITYLKVILAFFPLFLVELFRWNVGVDVVYGSGYYFYAYEAVKHGLGNIFHYEPGFYNLMRLSNAMHFNLYAFYCLITIIFFVCFTRFIYEKSEDLILSIILFVISDLYLFTFSTLRQTLGIAIALYPFMKMIKEDNYYRKVMWWLSVILAISFHSSILYLFLITFISKIKFSRKKIITLVPILCVLSLITEKVFAKILSFVPYVSKYLGSNMDVSKFSITYFGIALALFLISVFYYKELMMEDEKSYVLINICAFTAVLMLNSKLLIMPYRIYPLFIPAYIILCTKIIKLKRKRTFSYYITKMYLIVPFVLLFMNQYYFSEGKNYFIYRTIFDNMNQVFGASCIL